MIFNGFRKIDREAERSMVSNLLQLTLGVEIVFFSSLIFIATISEVKTGSFGTLAQHHSSIGKFSLLCQHTMFMKDGLGGKKNARQI